MTRSLRYFVGNTTSCANAIPCTIALRSRSITHSFAARGSQPSNEFAPVSSARSRLPGPSAIPCTETNRCPVSVGSYALTSSSGNGTLRPSTISTSVAGAGGCSTRGNVTKIRPLRETAIPDGQPSVNSATTSGTSDAAFMHLLYPRGTDRYGRLRGGPTDARACSSGWKTTWRASPM